jgi:glycosyltransferase involved in cell wall biosynthesis
MLDALASFGTVEFLTHRARLVPDLSISTKDDSRTFVVGTQPITVHSEALLAGRRHRDQLSSWDCAWAVNSRYAGALQSTGVPYCIWEATTIRDELRVASIAEVRDAGIGSGAGIILHRALLRLDESFERTFYRRAARVFAMSEYTREQIIATHGMPEQSIQVLTHPPSRAFLEALGRARPRTSWMTAASVAFRLLFVGRVDDPRKNFSLLLGALQRLRSAGRDVSLTVIGPHSAQWRERLHADESALSLNFLGTVDHDTLVAAYLGHDLLIVPSQQEGLGIVVVEAMHAGLPIVATRCGGPETILRESGAGDLVRHHPDELVQAIARMIDAPDERARRGLAGRAYANRELAIEPFVDRVRAETLAVAGATQRARTL